MKSGPVAKMQGCTKTTTNNNNNNKQLAAVDSGDNPNGHVTNTNTIVFPADLFNKVTPGDGNLSKEMQNIVIELKNQKNDILNMKQLMEHCCQSLQGGSRLERSGSIEKENGGNGDKKSAENGQGYANLNKNNYDRKQQRTPQLSAKRQPSFAGFLKR